MKPSTTNAEHPRCTICSYIREHPDCGINQMLVDGVGPTEVARRFPELKAKAIAHHNGCWNHGHPGVPHYAENIKKTRRHKEGLDLNERIDAIYAKCMELCLKAELAADKTDNPLHYKAAASCLQEAGRVLALLKPDPAPITTQTTTINNYDNLTKEELRELVRLTSKIEGTEESTGKEKPA